MLVAPKSIVFAYHSTFAHCEEGSSLLLCIAIVGYYVFALLSSFKSALVGEPVESVEVFVGAKNFQYPVLCFTYRHVCTAL